MAFISDRSGDPDVWVMNADGSNPVNVTNTDLVHESAPAWSPQAAKVAYSAFVDMSSLPEGYVVFTTGAPTPSSTT